MTALDFLSQPLWQRLTFALLHFVWQGALVGLLLALALVFARRATTRYRLALFALGAITICPLVTALWQSSATTEALPMVTTESATVETTTDGAWPLAELTFWQPYVLLVWLVGVLLLSGRLLLSYLSVRRLRQSTLPLDANTRRIAEHLRTIIRVSQRVQVRASEQVRDALVVGLWQPLVLLPASWLTELESPVLEAVLAHELSHIRRHDLWVNLWQRIVETLLFYHPAVWYVSQVLRVEREKCCDELAVAATGEKVVYVEALELVARRRWAASPSMWAAAMGGTRTMNLLDRVRNVLGLNPTASTARYWPVGVAALIVPAGLWCASLAFAPAAQAQEENPAGDPPAVRREGERREEGRPRVEGERREGERPREGDRPRVAGERREGDRPREGERREGDRPPPREGERREGDRSREGGDRPPMREGNPAVPQDLLRLIAELREEVGMLRREVRELRAGRGMEGRPRVEWERRMEGRPEGAPGRGRPGVEGARPEGGRPEGAPRGEGERRPEGRRPDGAPRGEGERRPDGPRPEGI